MLSLRGPSGPSVTTNYEFFFGLSFAELKEIADNLLKNPITRRLLSPDVYRLPAQYCDETEIKLPSEGEELDTYLYKIPQIIICIKVYVEMVLLKSVRIQDLLSETLNNKDRFI